MQIYTLHTMQIRGKIKMIWRIIYSKHLPICILCLFLQVFNIGKKIYSEIKTI